MFFQQIVNGVSIGSIYALIASGYALIYSLLGFSNWAHGEVAMVGAYIAWVGASSLALPLLPALLLGMAGAGLVSVCNERFFYRPIREHNAPSMFLMIAAMGLSTIFQNGSMLLFGAKFQRYSFSLPLEPVLIFGARIDAVNLICLLVSTSALVALELVINRTKFGLGVRAIASNSRTASLLGINVNQIFLIVFLIAGFLAGVAGFFLGLKYNVYPTMGNVGLKAFIASVFGGLGSVPGAIIGALVIGIVEALAAGYLNSGLRDLLTFSLLVIILVIKPSGLMGVTVEEKA
ncbi:MAG: branched-chain amino acid ABC transporter permease [Spirochaetaceae bacterium]|jgi:branched-chain amino acid transport system permease protein|nr:branched-chain amino acid ABC transporter permease [Spirochaetaceae bacterium]